MSGSAALVSGATSGTATAAPPTIEDFFRKPAYGSPQSSPSGRYLAVIAPVGERLGLGVIGLDDKSVVRMKPPADGDVIRVEWIDDERLAVVIGDLQRATGDAPTPSGLVAVNRDGSDEELIGDFHLEHERFHRSWSVRLVKPIVGTKGILVTALERDILSRDLYRVDTETGAKHLLSFESPGFVQQWIVDFDNVPRAVVTADVDADKSAWYVRKSANDPWVKVEETHLGNLTSGPMQFDASGRILYAWARRGGDDRASIYEYTVASGAWKKVVSHPVRDIDADTSVFVDDWVGHRVLGLRYTDDRTSPAWFDPLYERVQKGVDLALPGMVNVLQHDGDQWLVTSYSDRDPGDVYLLDGKTMKMQKLLSFEPQIDPRAMAPTKWVRYPARHGLVIPALLTVPNSAAGKPVPL
ncbi:MAG: hypothetical protein ACREX6_08420, partial [Casimicrobiaceae bacterium]